MSSGLAPNELQTREGAHARAWAQCQIERWSVRETDDPITPWKATREGSVTLAASSQDAIEAAIRRVEVARWFRLTSRKAKRNPNWGYQGG